MKRISLILLSSFVCICIVSAQPNNRQPNRGQTNKRQPNNNWVQQKRERNNNDMNNYKMRDALSESNIHPFQNRDRNNNKNGNWNRAPVRRKWNGAIQPARPGIGQYRPRPGLTIGNNYDPHNWWRNIRNIPGKRPPIYWKGHHYYYHDGNFFNTVDGIFRIVLPVVGFIINSLPSGATKVNNYNNYYYYHGVYYTQTSNGYEVTNPPVGACVSELPYFAQEETIDGQTYYTYDNGYFIPAYDSDGSICYEVIDSLQ